MFYLVSGWFVASWFVWFRAVSLYYCWFCFGICVALFDAVLCLCVWIAVVVDFFGGELRLVVCVVNSVEHVRVLVFFCCILVLCCSCV